MFKNYIKNQKGFSLIEVMIAMAILSLGILSIAKMQINSESGNFSSTSVTEATNIARETINTIKEMDYANANLLLDINTADFDAGLDDNSYGGGAAPDYTLTKLSFITNQNYTVDYNVAENWPLTDTTTVRVIVSWIERGIGKSIETVTMDFIKYDPTSVF